MNYWLVVGAIRNWQTAFKYGNIWGLKNTQHHLWENIKENDKLIFYATSPVSGIIGHGIIKTKVRQDRPLWPEEIRKNIVIWPLRFEFNVVYCLPPVKWKTNKIVSKMIWPRAGFQLLSTEAGQELISNIQTYIYPVPTQSISMVAEESTPFIATSNNKRVIPSHDDLQRKLIEIGKLQGYIAEPEYSFDIGRLDVVWRRVSNSVPTYVFEVQVGGDVYHALAKLKHAFDLWNSHIFLVASQTDYNKAEDLLSGTFHEISKRIKFIDLEKVEELYNRKKSYFEFEKELGIVI